MKDWKKDHKSREIAREYVMNVISIHRRQFSDSKKDKNMTDKEVEEVKAILAWMTVFNAQVMKTKIKDFKTKKFYGVKF